jgi:hypothetical protein
MPKSANTVAEDLISMVQKSGEHAITIPWPKMYKICDRERFHDEFKAKLLREVKKRTFLIVYGTNVVVVCQDANFHEV